MLIVTARQVSQSEGWFRASVSRPAHRAGRGTGFASAFAVAAAALGAIMLYRHAGAAPERCQPRPAHCE